MKRMLCIFVLVLSCGGLAHADKTNPFRIDGINVVYSDPCKVRFQVQYYINPAVSQPCYIGGYIPNRAAMSAFTMNQAGAAPAGLPKGQKQFTDNVTFEMNYRGFFPYTSSTIEVVIFDSAGTRRSRVFNWDKVWKRFDVQAVNRIYTMVNHVKFQVRYFIDPTWNGACFIGAFVPNQASAHPKFFYKPAGREPNGVAKGQKQFSDNVVVELMFDKSPPVTSTTLEVVMYNTTFNRSLSSLIVNWGQYWHMAAFEGQEYRL